MPNYSRSPRCALFYTLGSLPAIHQVPRCLLVVAPRCRCTRMTATAPPAAAAAAVALPRLGQPLPIFEDTGCIYLDYNATTPVGAARQQHASTARVRRHQHLLLAQPAHPASGCRPQHAVLLPAAAPPAPGAPLCPIFTRPLLAAVSPTGVPRSFRGHEAFPHRLWQPLVRARLRRAHGRGGGDGASAGAPPRRCHPRTALVEALPLAYDGPT